MAIPRMRVARNDEDRMMAPVGIGEWSITSDILMDCWGGDNGGGKLRIVSSVKSVDAPLLLRPAGYNWRLWELWAWLKWINVPTFDGGLR